MGVPVETTVLAVDARSPRPEDICRAAAVLRRGGLVAFPTETVYGLGANALDAAAVGRIFEAKGRPSNNPVIVHVSDESQARALTGDWTPDAARLATQFWPGPLTLVLRRRDFVPDVVTAGGDTVAVRIPAHPVAQALLAAAAVPVAAPSANRSTALSPTTAEHVVHSLGGRIDLVLDGGPTPGGIESTVVDVSVTPPRLLRPGLIELSQLEAIVVARSPGQMARHYAPRTPLICVEHEDLPELRAEKTRRVGWLTLSSSDRATPVGTDCIALPNDPRAYAALLYASLHQLDAMELDRIIVELPPDEPRWAAIRDRLRRASS
jgi:L-threonylcarbamoyladenylate synthase